MTVLRPPSPAALEHLREAAGLVVRQLTRRLGSLEAAFLERINSLSVEATEDLGEALLDFHEISDLSAWLDSQVGRARHGVRPWGCGGAPATSRARVYSFPGAPQQGRLAT